MPILKLPGCGHMQKQLLVREGLGTMGPLDLEQTNNTVPVLHVRGLHFQSNYEVLKMPKYVVFVNSLASQ